MRELTKTQDRRSVNGALFVNPFLRIRLVIAVVFGRIGFPTQEAVVNRHRVEVAPGDIGNQEAGI